MLKIHAEPPKPELAPTGIPLFALGFRPFFLLAGLSAVLLMSLWVVIWSGVVTLPNYYGFIGWHSHEMLFGYTTAVIGGFLLAAVRNWSGVNTPVGRPLATLALLWLAGRLAPLLAETIPTTLIAVLDLAFLPALAFALKPALWKGTQKVNRIFVPLLLLMALANLLVHLQPLGITDTAIRGMDLMLNLILMTLLFISGRVVPFFTEAVLPGFKPKRWPTLETASVIALVALTLAQLLYPIPWLVGPLALTVALTQGIRFSGWFNRRAWSIPILGVLHSGLIWIICGFVMMGLAAFEIVGIQLAKHALTVGGIGVLTLGMMTRVSLGHTGRPLQPSPLMALAFWLLNLGVVVRVLAPLVWPNQYTLWIHASSCLWIICFLLFSSIHLPILLQPRVDGQAG